MISKPFLFVICLTFVWASIANAVNVDITTIGAVGDGKTDSTKVCL